MEHREINLEYEAIFSTAVFIEAIEPKWAESRRLLAERERLFAESNRLWAESDRLWAEMERLLAESRRLLAERERLFAESRRLRAEMERLRAESLESWNNNFPTPIGDAFYYWRATRGV